MNTISLGDMARSFQMRRDVTTAKVAVNRHLTETTTGTAADQAARLRGDFTALGGIEHRLKAISGYRTATTEAAVMAGSMQTALETVQTHSEARSTALIAASAAGGMAGLHTAAAEARGSMSDVIAALNTRVGDRSVFAGTATDRAAVISAEDILSQLVTLTTGLATAGDVEAAVSAWFDAGVTGFGGLAYQGSADGPAALPLDAGGSARLGVTANDPALRDTLKGLAMAALLDTGLLAGQPAAAKDLARLAGERLIAAGDAVTEVRAGVGVTEARIEDMATSHAAEAGMLEQARLNLLSVDPYESATALKSAEAQLDTLYALTNRLSRLSLAEYLA